VIETNRLRFRPYGEGDFAFVLSLTSDPEVMRYIGDGRTKSREETEKMFARWLSITKGGTGLFLAQIKETGEMIGHAGVVEQKVDGIKEWEIGYWLARPYWGQGYATEMAAAFRDYAIRVLKRERFICIIQPGNHASVGVARKIGMKKEKETCFHSIPVHIYAWEK
jgi:RimJ/RimL family protein N-acetyltransferase